MLSSSHFLTLNLEKLRISIYTNIFIERVKNQQGIIKEDEKPEVKLEKAEQRKKGSKFQHELNQKLETDPKLREFMEVNSKLKSIYQYTLIEKNCSTGYSRERNS